MSPLHHQQAQWDAEALPEPAPESTALQLPAGWPWLALLAFTALYFGEVLFALWWRA